MPATGRNGALTWMLGLLTLASILNLFNAIIQLNLNGMGATAQFTFFLYTLGSLEIEAYFWLSTITTIIFFSLTIVSIYRGLPLDPQIKQRLAKVEESLVTNSNMLENTQIGFFRKIEDVEKANDETHKRINQCIESNQKVVTDNLTQQKTVLERIENQTEKQANHAEKQAAELAKLKKNIQELATPPEKPKLTGKTKLENLRNIPPKLATKLNQIMITNASEFLANDSFSIAERVQESPEKIADMQAMAQLLMVPGIDEKHSELLVKVGITSRKELADQDPVHLYRSLNAIAKTYVELRQMTANQIPTLEEVQSWIKQAHL